MLDVYGREIPRSCSIDGVHCENCGRVVGEECGVWDGYTSCCNELVSYGVGDCRAFHDEVPEDYPPGFDEQYDR